MHWILQAWWTSCPKRSTCPFLVSYVWLLRTSMTTTAEVNRAELNSTIHSVCISQLLFLFHLASNQRILNWWAATTRHMPVSYTGRGPEIPCSNYILPHISMARCSYNMIWLTGHTVRHTRTTKLNRFVSMSMCWGNKVKLLRRNHPNCSKKWTYMWYDLSREVY